MSLRADFEGILSRLPYSIRDEILGYIASVEASAEDIFREAGVEKSDIIQDQLLFFSGVRRLYSLTSSYYWLLDRSLRLVGEDAEGVSLGRTRLRRGEGVMAQLHLLVEELTDALAQHEVLALVRGGTLADVVRQLAAERPR